MILVSELKAWLETLNPDSSVAVDGGGLALVEYDPDTDKTGAYCEVGGEPDDEAS